MFLKMVEDIFVLQAEEGPPDALEEKHMSESIYVTEGYLSLSYLILTLLCFKKWGV